MPKRTVIPVDAEQWQGLVEIKKKSGQAINHQVREALAMYLACKNFLPKNTAITANTI